MNLLFTICARAGSKGVKNKNVRSLNGYPLVYYTLSAFKLFKDKHGADYINIDLAINTDSNDLVEQFYKTKIEGKHIVRKKELAGDRVGKMDVIRDTLFEMEKNKEIRYDIVIDLDLTSPIRTVADIEGTLEKVLGDKKADIAYSVTSARRSPYFNMVCQKENGYFDKVLKSNFVSRQETPECFDMNASIYAYRREYLCTFEKTPDRKALVWIMPDTGILDIDGEEDYELIQIIAEYLTGKNSGLKEIKDNIRICYGDEMR